MKIGILGTGAVGRAITGRCAELGHDVVVGTRDVTATLARTEPDRMGTPPFAGWLAAQPTVRLVPNAEAAAHGELVVNATNGAGSIAALTSAGDENLAGKPLLDISNPLDFSAGMPPTLFVKDADSLAEQIQRAFPAARVVKSLNTMTNAVMVNPALVADGRHTVFLSGDDAEAKAVVRDLLTELGWTDILDLGGLSTARGTEMLVPLWLRVWGALGTLDFNFSVAR